MAGAWRYRQTQAQLFAELAINTRQYAMAFDPAELGELAGSSDEAAKSALTALQQRLSRLRYFGPGVRSVYLFRYLPAERRTVLLAASGSPVMRYFPVAGETGPNPVEPGFPLSLRGETATRGPTTDDSGEWVTGFAEVIGPRTSPAIDVLGLDVAAGHWRGTLWAATMGTAGYVWMLLILPLATLVSTRRQNRQRDTLRNLHEAMEQGQSAVMIVGLNQRIIYVNAGFCRQLGYTREELVGREWREFQGFEAPPALVRKLAATVRAGHPWTGEWTMRRKDGGFFPVRGGVTPVKDRNGRIRSFVSVFEDVTEIRRTESMLREAKERAEAGDRAKGQFLATMSHEVRTPLNGIVGFASLLLDTELTPEQQEFVATIRTSSETLIQLTGDILDYARIESGRLKLEPQPCDPRECVENALDLVASAAAAKKIELLHWIDDSVPPAIIADLSRLRQILVNLANNAVKFTSSGVVEVRVRARPLPSTEAEPASTELEFSIRDTGIGIAAQHHDKIFRPFSQADETTTRRFGGTGLGLAICKNLVELMGGTISFTSTQSAGSTFTFTIRASLHAADGLLAHQPSLEGRQVAIVAENAGLRHELKRLAERLGATVTCTDLNGLRQETSWHAAVVDVTESIAVETGALPEPPPQLPPEKMIGLVSIVLPTEIRAALRPHFRVLLNKPPHHDMLSSLLAARTSAAPFTPTVAETPPRTFDLDVLIVEDNIVNQQLIQRVIASLGCRWTAANHGREALEKLSTQTPDLVLMDLHMPEMDGLTAIKKIRAGAAGVDSQRVWIIALTADARAEQRQRTLAAGANDYLTKPVQRRDLMAALERYEHSIRP